MTANTATLNPRKRLGPVRLSLLILAAIAIVIFSGAGFYTDVLWFKQLGYDQVFTTGVVAQTTVFALAGLTYGLLIWGSLFVAYKSRPIYSRMPDSNDFFAPYREFVDALRRLALIVLPIVIGLLAGASAAPQWPTVLAWMNRTYTGESDPQFGLDTGFYLFELPFLNKLAGFLSIGLLLATLLGAFVHLIYGNIKFLGRGTRVSKVARIQVSISAAAYLLIQGATLWLDQYSTVTSATGLFTGATYTDVNARIPAFQILAYISIAVALSFIVTAIVAKWRISLMATGLMVVTSLVVGGIYPWIVQSFQVAPNERTMEAPYIDRNIKATLAAYGLDNIELVSYDAKTTTEPGALREYAETTANIRIIDPALVSASFKQLEQYKQYYDFGDHLDVDRYAIDGKTQDTVIAVRELNQTGLGDAQSWYNNVVVYTHGYGVVAAYGNQRSIDGQPVFLQKGIPSSGALGNYEPRVYFGEQSPVYSIVGAPKGAAAKELDYPASDANSANSTAQQMYTFTGNGGPKLDNFASRLAYAIKFQSEQILLSNAITDESQILYNRNPLDRVKAVAPYLTLDSDPYPAVVDGKLLWIVDGYTTSADYPYSRAENMSSTIADTSTTSAFNSKSVNYIRNSVKATVNAYDGSVNLYAWDEKDPILKTWQKVYPNTIKPVSAMSASLIAHVRYPADLFKMQRAILGRYHVTDAGSFYSEDDAWMTPNDPVEPGIAATGKLQPPYYLTMQAPGADKPSFSLYSTFIPRSTDASSRNVLTGYLMVDSDAGAQAGKVAAGYGKLRLLKLPKSTIVPGPGQVQNNFNADSEVSRLLNILRQGSTNVLNGNLLTLPIGGGLLYVQPVYIQSKGSTSFPLLKKVLVAFGDKIAFEDSLDAALNSLFGGDSGAGSGVTPPVTPTTPGSQPGADTNAALTDALNRAAAALKAKQTALAAGDWTAYGEADAALAKAVADAIAAKK
ncbi:MAG: UPF0182 family protein [Actinomycetales bacterium]|nr:UPF0182 family protein [Actinomycetales bacterium]